MMSPDGDEVTVEALVSIGEDERGTVGVALGDGCTTMDRGVSVVVMDPGLSAITVDSDVGIVAVDAGVGAVPVGPGVGAVIAGSSAEAVTVDAGLGIVPVGSGVEAVTMDAGVGVVPVGSEVSVVSTLLQDDRGVSVKEGDVTAVPVMEVIVALHSKREAAVGVERAKEPPVDQKLVLKANPARSASTASATQERARV
jgi:hypothetical protein